MEKALSRTAPRRDYSTLSMFSIVSILVRYVKKGLIKYDLFREVYGWQGATGFPCQD